MFENCQAHRKTPVKFQWNIAQPLSLGYEISCDHNDVIKWKHFPRYWPFVRGIHRSPVTSPHKGQWRGALMFYLICAWTNGWVNNRDAGVLRRHCAYYDVTAILIVNSSYPFEIWQSAPRGQFDNNVAKIPTKFISDNNTAYPYTEHLWYIAVIFLRRIQKTTRYGVSFVTLKEQSFNILIILLCSIWYYMRLRYIESLWYCSCDMAYYRPVRECWWYIE